MDLTAITQLITSVGFPIAACIVMGWYVKKQTDNYREDVAAYRRDVTELNDRHKEEIAKVTEALNNNTIALTKLTDSLVERRFVDGRAD